MSLLIQNLKYLELGIMLNALDGALKRAGSLSLQVSLHSRLRRLAEDLDLDEAMAVLDRFPEDGWREDLLNRLRVDRPDEQLKAVAYASQFPPGTRKPGNYPDDWYPDDEAVFLATGRSLGFPADLLEAIVKREVLRDPIAQVEFLKEALLNEADRHGLVFISYTHADQNAARQLNFELRSRGFTTWLDKVNLLPGQDWNSAIRSAIKSADLVLVLISKQSTEKRGYFQKEIALALDTLSEVPEQSIYLVPVLLEECPIPERLSHLHAVEWASANGLQKLVDAIEFQLGRLSSVREDS